MNENQPKIINISESKDITLQKLIESPEIKSIIELRFFRHSIKENDKTKSDMDIGLTTEGRSFAKGQAEENTNLEQSVAFGSPRKRTQETAMFVMAGQEENVLGNETFDELKNKLEEGLEVGSKIGVEKELDFKENKESEYYKELIATVGEGRYLKYLVEESDQRAKELGDNHSATYTRMAQQVSKIIEKYVSILPRWSELVTEKPDQYNKVLERFMGTHQGIGESFLAKIIELTEGEERRNQFVKSLSGKGFDFVEGFKVYVADQNKQQPKLMIEYKHTDKEDQSNNFEFIRVINYLLLDEIINGEDVNWF